MRQIKINTDSILALDTNSSLLDTNYNFLDTNSVCWTHIFSFFYSHIPISKQLCFACDWACSIHYCPAVSTVYIGMGFAVSLVKGGWHDIILPIVWWYYYIFCWCWLFTWGLQLLKCVPFREKNQTCIQKYNTATLPRPVLDLVVLGCWWRTATSKLLRHLWYCYMCATSSPSVFQARTLCEKYVFDKCLGWRGEGGEGSQEVRFVNAFHWLQTCFLKWLSLVLNGFKLFPSVFMFFCLIWFDLSSCHWQI